jgi:hypothetical protein
MPDKSPNAPAKKTTPAETTSFTTATEAASALPAARASVSGTPTAGAADASATASAGAATHTADAGAKDDAKATAAAARDRAEELSDEARDKAQGFAASAKDKAAKMAESRVNGVKDQAAGQIDEAADRVRAAGADLSDEDGYPAQAADYLADNLAQAAAALRDADMGSMLDDATHFARRNPAMFLGGAALLGFAAGRLMKASNRDHEDTYARPYDAYPYDRRA